MTTSSTPGTTATAVDLALTAALSTVRRNSATFGSSYPDDTTLNGRYLPRPAAPGFPLGGNRGWTTSFFSGMEWLAWELTQDETFRDAALAHADVFVTNGGYGGVTHSVINGVPMVAGGITEDKIEVTARVEYVGLGVNLKTQSPTSEAVAAAVDKVLRDPSYKKVAVRLKAENEDLDSLSILEKEIWKYASA